MKSRLGKFLFNTALFAAGALTTAVVTDRVMEKKEKEQFKPYGFKVETKFGGFNVDIRGEKGPAIVLLSGYGASAPILDFKPLSKELSRFAKVITIEYLGYGCSDNTDRPRRLKNISEEIHEVLDRLNIEKYWIMPHSISGIYALDYVRRYPNEVQGLLLIDTSVPEQIDYMGVEAETKIMPLLTELGIMRILDMAMPGKFTPNSEDYEEEDLKTIKAMTLWHDDNPAVKDEGKRLVENMSACRGLGFPEKLPVLMFVCTSNIEMTKGWWKDLHEKQLETTHYGKMIILEGTHCLHWTKSAEMAVECKRFILETLERKLSEAENQLNG